MEETTIIEEDQPEETRLFVEEGKAICEVCYYAPIKCVPGPKEGYYRCKIIGERAFMKSSIASLIQYLAKSALIKKISYKTINFILPEIRKAGWTYRNLKKAEQNEFLYELIKATFK